MKRNFWKEIKKPFFVLAPMADVTDVAFRRVIAKYGKPDVMWTEFVSADGLVRAPEEGKKKLLKDLEYDESERPIVAQLFSSNPEYMEKAAHLVAECGFDGIDINMGCPDQGIEKQGCGAAMIRNPDKAQAVIYAAMKSGLPVSVKTRIGYNKNELDTWLLALLETKPAAITIHARTRKEMSKVPARWEHVKEAVEIRDRLKSETLIIGNGDLVSIEDAKNKVEESGADGAMLGRAIFGNPWLFAKSAEKNNFQKSSDLLSDNLKMTGQTLANHSFLTTREKLKVLVEHTNLFQELLGGTKSFALMKKHFKAYVQGFPGANELRAKLMETNSAKEVAEIIQQFK
jgi:nifR3 family TIM-barrel protein